MPTLALSDCQDVGNTAVTNVSNFNGAADGSVATADLNSDGVLIDGACNLSVVSTLAGLQLIIRSRRVNGSTGQLNTVSLSTEANGAGTGYTWIVETVLATSLGNITIDLSQEPDSGSGWNLAAAQAIRFIQVNWNDPGDSGGTLEADSASISYTGDAVPSTARTVASGDDLTWSNKDNALTSNNQRATCTIDDAGGARRGDWLVLYGFGIGAGTITGIHIEGSYSGSASVVINAAACENGATVDNATLEDRLSVPGATDIALGDSESSVDVTANIPLGGLDTGGANFGIAIRGFSDDVGVITTFSIDALSITYTEASTGNTPKHRKQSIPRFRGTLAAR